MSRIILKIATGDWDGGHNGLYPKLVEWNLDDEDFPIEESDGWGHGFGGGRSSIQSYVSSGEFGQLKDGESGWAYEIILNSMNANLTIKEIGNALLTESRKHPVKIPEKLLIILNRNGNYENV